MKFRPVGSALFQKECQKGMAMIRVAFRNFDIVLIRRDNTSTRTSYIKPGATVIFFIRTIWNSVSNI